MDYMKIGARTPPPSKRAPWARELLSEAKRQALTPCIVPAHEVIGFTVNMPPHLADWLRSVAAAHDMSPALAAAGLIQAVKMAQDANSALPTQEAEPIEDDPHLARVSQVLRPLATSARAAMQEGKIAFCEGATGTGKGRLIISLALGAIAQGKRVVISAPIPVLWQLTEELREFEDGDQIPLALLFGRPNFIDPEALREWAEETECQPVLAWIEEGGPPRSEAAVALSRQLRVQLDWLLEEALALAEDIPVDRVMLDANVDPEEENPAERVYQALRKASKEAPLILCSHHLLAHHCRQLEIRAAGSLPDCIDVLLVDEAHQLESAFASINSQTLHLHALARTIQRSTGTGKRDALNALSVLEGWIHLHLQRSNGDAVIAPLSELEGLESIGVALIESLDAMQVKKSDSTSRRALARAKAVLRSTISGMTTVQLDRTPVRHYPLLTTGKSNLERPFRLLWERVGAAALVSATLYTDEQHAGLMRWKVAVPKERAHYIPPVIPEWVRAPVLLRRARVAIPPDESDAWHDALASQIEEVAQAAAGGTLVLATAYATIEGLVPRLSSVLGSRLIAQRPQASATTCAAAFRRHGKRPVWLGVGAAWTGIDLSDKSVPASEDTMLTDLVICRLPFGMTRSLTHHRRMQIAGPGVNVQEALWIFRQGIGRLVRREGVPPRNLWVLDSRIDDGRLYMAGFRKILESYRQE